MTTSPTRLPLRAALAAALVAVGCAGPAASGEPDARAASPAPTAPAAPAPAEPEAPQPLAPPNRDPHGPEDVARYVAILESEERVAMLDPERVVARLALAPDARVADLGCGPGVFALPLAAACPDGVVYAVDVEPRQLDAVREKLLAGGVDNVVPVLASPSDPHLPPGELDLLLIVDTWHHLRDRVAYARDLRGLLAPDGRLAVLEYLPGDLPVGPPADHKLPAGVREAELEEAGFELVEESDLVEWHELEVWRPRRDPDGRAGGAGAGDGQL